MLALRNNLLVHFIEHENRQYFYILFKKVRWARFAIYVWDTREVLFQDSVSEESASNIHGQQAIDNRQQLKTGNIYF